MKKIIVFVFTLFAISAGTAQDPDPDLLRTWHLHNLVLDGENNVPYGVGFSVVTEYYYEAGDDQYFMYLPTDIDLGTSWLEFDPIDPIFTIVDHVGLAEGICNEFPSPCWDFYAIFRPFYHDFFGTPMSYEINDAGGGELQLIVTNVNGDQAIYYSYVLGTGVSDLASLVIYPNPTAEELFIASENIVFESVEIYSVGGERILLISENVKSINVSSLSKGMYFLELNTTHGRTIQKFIKE
ncbi:MAG: T9SS type A sorting domain-containing protein [Bacteroidia bacterium]|nr:T9SS type A sorting domain-containing protein [Bacteroidia bacterium]NNM22431.1 T9SS type A sorting domain-containing protein [Flavobacteriaceae bacterium]